MKKIGIVTQFKNNHNYGGILQSYALVEFLKKSGYDVEQISFNGNGYKISDDNENKKFKIMNSFNYRIRHLPYLIFNKVYNLIFYNKILLRKTTIDKFSKKYIDCSSIIYNDDTIKEARDYDFYITGSDQVWNLDWYIPAYWLTFVEPGKCKIAYAASMAMNNLNCNQQKVAYDNLRTFNAISVRENKSVQLLNDLVDLDVHLCVDPTLLLDKNDWAKICSEDIIKGKYVFCYFLGNNMNSRKCAKQFSKKHGYKIVNLPHMNGLNFGDIKLGDYNLYDIDPSQFISLIKNADYIFTDSFHAIIFSFIFNKQYFVFNRNKQCEMNSRIYDILELFENLDRFCDGEEKEKMGYIENLERINYDKQYLEFDRIKKESIEYLKDNLY